MKWLRLQQRFQYNYSQNPSKLSVVLHLQGFLDKFPKVCVRPVKGRFYSSDAAYVHGGHL